MSADAYAAVWRPGSGAQWWRSGMSYDDFKSQDKTYFDQNLRIDSLAVREGRSFRPERGKIDRGRVVGGHRSAIAHQPDGQACAVLANVVADGIRVAHADRGVRPGMLAACKHQDANCRDRKVSQHDGPRD